MGEPTGLVHHCRHCPSDIMFRAGYWVNADGFPYCMKRGYDSHGKLRPPLLHEPMPVIAEPVMLPASQSCSVDTIIGGEPCPRMAQWVWKNGGGQPVFLCNHHHQPFA